jgi:hypothetical protein
VKHPVKDKRYYDNYYHIFKRKKKRKEDGICSFPENCKMHFLEIHFLDLLNDLNRYTDGMPDTDN